MKTPKRYITAVALIAAVATVFTTVFTRMARADEVPLKLVSVLPSAGIVSGEMLRVNYLNVGSNPFEIIPCIFDHNGVHLKTGGTLMLLPGQTRSLDLSRSEVGIPGVGGRVQVRAAAHVAESDLKSLAASGEVIEEAIGRTTLFVPGTLNPQDIAREEDTGPSDIGGGEVTRSIAPVGITAGQTIRVSLVNIGSNPFEIIPCIFDGDGVHLKTGALMQIAPGQTLSFEMSSAESPIPSASRLLVRGAAHVRNADARSLLITGEVIEDSSGKSALFLPGTAIAPEYTRQANGQ